MSSTFRRLALGASNPKFFISVAATVMLAACSAESDRFAENPSDSDPVYTASVPQQTRPQVEQSDEVITTRPLNSASVKPPAYDYSKSYKAPQYKQPSYAKAPAVSVPDVEAPSVSSPQVETVEAPQVAAGGSVTVAPGMTLYAIARSNNMSVSQLAAANGIKAPYAVHTGQRLRIPGRNDPALPETASVEPRQAAPVATPSKPFKQAASATAGTGHTVSSGDTLFSLGRAYNVSPYAIADANGLPHNAQLSLGQKVKIPGSKGGTPVAFKKPEAESPKFKTASKQAPALPDAEDTESTPVKSETVAEAPVAKPEQAAPAAGQQVAEQAPIDGAASGMRWPVRGKVISGFGPKSNGLKNEGINIAVPEGTSVRAADGGVVAYAGNELKGYGNLVLIRHENGYVTAYAHAKELFVKRGDTVKRGDVIAKAGQTGSVSSPQLHFEVRKGATALDPIKFLASSTASN